MLLTGTTRFTPPEDSTPPNLTLVDDEAALHAAVTADQDWPLTAAAGHGSKGRLLPLDPAWLDRLHAARPELTIVVEADGSKMRPFKAPGEGEPVIPRSATAVLSVVGLDVIGRPLDGRAVHRPEVVAMLASVKLGTQVTPELVATVLLHPAGGRKGVPAGARWLVLLNKANSAERQASARCIGARLQTVAVGVISAQVREEHPVVAVFSGSPAV